MTTRQKLAAILVTDDSYTTMQRSISYLLKQTAIDQIELVMVCPRRDRLMPVKDEVEQFGDYQIVETGVALSSGQMLAEGIRATRSPAVFYVESHHFPPPNTAEVAIRELVERGRPVVGFAMSPANPGLIAWAHLYGQFGAVVGPVKAGPVKRLGGHHIAYRKDILMEYDPVLSDLLDNEAVLYELFGRRGIELYLASDAEIPHVQVSNFVSYFRHEYLAQRIFGAARAKVLRWSLGRRLLYVAGAPLIPFVRLRRSVADIRRTGRSRELLPQIIPVILCANVGGAVGEAMGYAFGDRALHKVQRMEIELDRYAFVSEADRARAAKASGE
jgi:hypothetical protein